MATIGSINLRMKADNARFKRDVRDASGAVKGLSDHVLATSTVIKTAFAAAVGGGAAVAIKRMISAGSDLAENVGKLGDIFGPQAKGVEADARAMADAYGVSLNSMLDGAGKLGGLFKGAEFTGDRTEGLSNQFNRLAVDASRFFNTDYDTAFNKIRSGLTGSSEPLQDFGVFLSADKTEAESQALGLVRVGEELTDHAKVAARASLIQKGLADASGNASKTASGAAARMEEFSGRVENLAATIGERLAPIAGAVLADLSSGITVLADLWGESSEAASQWAAGTVRGVGAVGDSLGGVRSAVGFLADAWQVVSHEFHLAQGIVLEAFTAIVAGAARAASAFDAIIEAVGGSSTGIGDTLTAAADSMRASLAEAQAAFDAESSAP